MRKCLALMCGVFLMGSLLACGGGGGGSNTDVSTTPTTSTTVPSVSVPSVTDVVAELNRLRISAEVNAVVANTQVMAAAQNHATYLTGITTAPSLHSEDPTKPGFTGVTPTDRVKAAGYDSQGLATEAVDPNALYQNTKADPMIPLRNLMNSPYHGLSMLSGHQDVGMGMKKTADGVTMYTVIDFATKIGAYAAIPTGEVRIWPCNGVDNILNRSLTSESPNPIPGRRLDTDPIGTPIYVQVTENQKLVLTTYELRNMATGGVAVIAKVLGQDSTDLLPQNQVAILPDKPLAVNTTYTATVTGLNAGKPFSKTCTFKTGNLSAFS